jgi:hypothetical protein
LIGVGGVSGGTPVVDGDVDAALRVGGHAARQQVVEAEDRPAAGSAGFFGAVRNWSSEVAGWRCSTTFSAQVIRRWYAGR